MEKTGEEQSVPSDHSVNHLSAWNAISCINTPQTASPEPPTTLPEQKPSDLWLPVN